MDGVNAKYIGPTLLIQVLIKFGAISQIKVLYSQLYDKQLA